MGLDHLRMQQLIKLLNPNYRFSNMSLDVHFPASMEEPLGVVAHGRFPSANLRSRLSKEQGKTNVISGAPAPLPLE